MAEQLKHIATGEVLATRVRWARTFRERMRGLIGSEIGPDEALIIRAAQVHTFFMSYSIDVVFCDGSWRVVHVVHGMRPDRVSRWARGARYAIEMRAGIAGRVAAGDRLAVE